MKVLRLTPCAAAVALAALQMSQPALAANCTLTMNGLWQTPGDWSCNARPGSGDSATINVGGLVHINQGEQITTLSNAGTIDIDAFSLTLLNGGSTTNTGTINVGTSSVTANLSVNNNVANAGGAINISNGSVVNVFNSSIAGGTITGTGTGSVNVYGGGGLDGVSNGALTLSTNTNFVAGISGNLIGTINNGGTIAVGDGSGNGTDIHIQGNNNLTLNGTGSLNLTNGNDRIFGDSGNDILTNGANHTIQGAGQIGINQAYVVNNGLITANLANQTLQFDPTDGVAGNNNEGLINNGTLRAENGGALNFLFGYYKNNGTISALNASAVNIGSNAFVEGGTLSTAGTGVINLASGARLDGLTNGAVTLAGNVNANAGQNVYAFGTVNGSLVVGDGSTNGTDLHIYGNNNLTLGGNGTLSLTNINDRVFGDNGNSVLTVNSGNTIQGAGQIGINSVNVVNNGLITANLNGQTLQIDPTDGSPGAEGFINNGPMRAENGGTLNLLFGYYKNAGSSITAQAGSTVNVTSGAFIEGGTLGAVGSGVVNLNSSARLDGQTYGALTLTGNVNANAGQNVYAFGTLNGSLSVGDGSTNGTDLHIYGNNNLTLGGNGTLSLTNINDRIFGDNGNSVLTVNSGNTIQGAGQIGINQAYVVNNGLITANLNGQTLQIDPTDGDSTNAGFINAGTIQAENGGNLNLFFGHYNNAAGTIAALNGSTVVVTNSAIIEGGTLTTTGTGTITLTSNAMLDGTAHGALTNNGAIVFADGQNIYATGSIVDNGTIAHGANTDLHIRGSSNLTISGTGTYTMASGARIYGDDGNDLLTNGAGHTIQGQGNIGANQINLANAGTINANVSGQTLTIDVTGGTSIANQMTGVLQASNGGTLSLVDATNGTGTIRSDSGGTVVLSQASTTGQLINNANLALGSNSITVSQDYSNANFGTGNGFNKRSNVTGTGQILASGDTAQAVTGATVTNGASATPTLTIGNVRVGGTTYVYQIANSGTSGPAIRGAIQTNVNGGNITDSRLSGSGVTASNYGPIATGSHSSDYSVTFTTNTAGALAPLSGQAVHIANNFDNVGEQTMDIVLGSGAAAYVAAAGHNLTAPLNFGTVQVGQTVSQTLSIQNTATGPSGYVEDLNASFGASFGTGANRITGSGTIAGLAAGSTNSSSLTVSVNTQQAGTVNGGIAIDYATAGTVNGVSNGLGTAAVGSENYAVSGTIQGTANVVDAAHPVVNTAQPIALGNVRIGSTSPTAAVSVTNQATGNQQAALDASISGNAPITASGSFNLLAPGATNSSGLQVGIDTSTAGAKSGTATIAFTSDANNVGNCGANCLMTLPSQNVSVNGAVYRLANGVVTSGPPITVAGRVGTTGPSTAIGITNSSPDVYTEGLTVTRGATSAGFTSAGSITNLAAQGSSNAITVSLNTTTAGTFTGTQALNFVTTGAGTDNAADMAVGSAGVTLNGKVYTPAVTQQNTSNVNFGIVHVGDTVTPQGVSVTNAAAVTALNDTLVGQAVGATGPFTASGNLGAGLAAGQTGANALKVGLGTGTAGVYGGTATFSTASHDSDLADAALASLSVSLSGTVNNYASDAFSKTGGSGTLSKSGSTFTLDFGTVLQNSGTETAVLAASNTANGPADLLDGMFQFLDPADFGESGFTSFSDLAAGMSDGALDLSFDTSTVGAFTDTIVLHGNGHNGSGYSAPIGDITLVVQGSVSAVAPPPPPPPPPPPNGVPEPDTLLLFGLGIPALLWRRRSRRVTAAN